MRLLDFIKDQINDEVLEYVSEWPAENSYETSETNLTIIADDGRKFDVTVEIKARFNFTEDWITDDYGRRVSLGKEVEVRDYDYEVKDIWDCEKGRYITDVNKEEA